MDPQATFQQIRALRLTQDDLKAATFRATSKGVTVTADGELKILSVDLPSKMPKVELEKAVQAAMNSLVKKVHKHHIDSVKSLMQ